jgi:tetratricopeptide (TPR) repeat protein
MSDLLVSFSENSSSISIGPDNEVKILEKMRSLMARHKIEEALKYYEELPVTLKNQRAMKLIYVQLCYEMEDGSYEKVLDEFQQLYPDESGMHLMMTDVYILRKDYDKALEGINKLDSMIDSDPFLDYMRALICNLKEDPEQARVYLEKLCKGMPYFDDGALELIASYLNAGEDEKAKRLVKEYKSKPEFDQESLDNYLLYFQPGFRSDME